MSNFDDRPIALFDSGIGGLTVLRTLLASLPDESFVYLGDTARLPYGSKSPQTIERYLRQNIEFLSRLNVKAIVVACNSASTVLFGKEHDFALPVYNVIEPGAETALRHSASKQIGVLGTKATVAARSYVTALERLEPKAQVFQQACPLLVPLVEEGWDNDPVTRVVVERYVKPLLSQAPEIDTLVLGCTHYPALREVIASEAGASVRLVDGAEAVVGRIRADFKAHTLGRGGARRHSLKIMTTDTAPGFLEVARRLMKPYEVECLHEVDIANPTAL
jgi:glutamate racemase